MEKNSRIPLPGGCYMQPTNDLSVWWIYRANSAGWVQLNYFSEQQAYDFAAAMQPQPTQSAVECAGFIFTMLNGQEPYSEKELCKDIQAYADEYAEARVKPLREALESAKNLFYQIEQLDNIKIIQGHARGCVLLMEDALANKEKSHG